MAQFKLQFPSVIPSIIVHFLQVLCVTLCAHRQFADRALDPPHTLVVCVLAEQVLICASGMPTDLVTHAT